MQPSEASGDRKTEAVGLARHGHSERAGGIPQRGGVNDQVGAPRRADAHPGGGVAGPDTGRVDDGPRAEREGGLRVSACAGRDGSGGVVVVVLVPHGHLRPRRLDHPCPREDPRAVTGGGPRDGSDQSRVVDEPAVPIDVAEAQPVPAHPRHVLGHARRAHHPGAGQLVGAGPRQARQQRPRHKPQARQHRAQRRRVAVHRHHLGEWPHQVRGGALEQDAALDRRASRDPDVAAGEVPQATVRELGRPATGAERQIVGLEQHGLESAGGGVERDPRAGYAAADHDEVDGRLAPAQLAEFASAAGGRQRGGGAGGRVGGRGRGRGGVHGWRYPLMSRWSSVRQVSASSGGSDSGADSTAPWTAR